MILKGIGVLSLILTVLGCIFGNFWLAPVYFICAFLVLLLLATAFLAAVCAPVNTEKPRERESKFFRAIVSPYVQLLLTLAMVKLETAGLENTPTDGRFLLVCNHQKFTDPVILLHCFRKSQLIFISKKENGKLPFVNKFLHALRCQMLDRDNDRQALRVILNCIKILKEDEASVMVFPEGYTSRDGKLHPFRSGVFKIAQKAGVPIVVCTVDGSAEILKNVKRLKRSRVRLHLVGVIPPEELAGKQTNEISHRIYEMMIADLGEEFRLP